MGTANLANPTVLGFVSVAKESTRGTYAAPVDYVPFTKFDVEDTTTWFSDDALRGSMVKAYDKVAGPQWAKISMQGPVYADTFGYPLMGILGDCVTTGSSAPYTHVGAVKNSADGQPTTQSWTDFNSVDTRGYTSVSWYDLGVTWDGEKALDWTGTAQAYASAVQTKPTSAPSTVRMYPGWLGAVTLGGSSSQVLISADIKFKRAGDPIHTSDGTQPPLEIFVAEMDCTGKIVVVADLNTQLTNYLTSPQQSLVVNFTSGTGATLTQVKFQFSKFNYDLAKPVRGKKWMEYEIDFEALGNTTDVGASGGYSLCKATLQNAKVSGTFQ